MTREIALHCMKSASELERELCEECPIYGQTGCDHCYEDALQYVIAMLEQEPTSKNNLGVDCISRTRAIERLKLNFPISEGADNSRDRHRYMQALADLQAIRELPSVTPQPRKGHWIPVYQGDEIIDYRCSECEFGNTFGKSTIGMNFCPNCGAKMKGEVEE